MSLADQTCVPCKSGAAPLAGAELRQLAAQLPGWDVMREHHLERHFAFPDFVTALDFVNRVGALAEQQGHHPDIYLTWGKVKIEIYTHSVGGLSPSDFILGAKIERAFTPPL